MAAQSLHDAVIQPESADAPSPADVSEPNNTHPAARAAAFAQTASTENSLDPLAGSGELASSDAKLRNAGAHEQNKTLSQTNEVTADDPATTETVAEPAPLVNGVSAAVEPREVELAENDSIRSAGVEGSLGSDTDTSKNEATSSSKDAVLKHAVRKSATFKPVSVTKNLLAKTSGVSTPTKSTSDKAPLTSGSPAMASAQPVARPRLVAKTVSGQKLSTPKLSGMGNKDGRGAGPDPNQVWNRNRVAAAPQATPKHLTDEELRQQYGIQLASRPQDDGDNKEAKWADIDDDEDDWAPETIEWNDGTKINLSQVEPASGKAEPPAEPPKEETKPVGAPSHFSAQKPTTVGPNATVLKLGSAAQAKTPANPTQKPTDKPTLVYKPSAPTPVKSPWAALPAVDKVPPVAINPPVEQLPSRFGLRNMHGFDAMPPPPPLQAKEIAADDFSRFPGDGPNTGPRELFNSQSGRYEPVNDARRQSFRKDGNYRQPAVLQRPSQTDPHAPAEPSPAFQTRRRGSSNLSGESGKFGPRMMGVKGFENRAPDARFDRRGSQGEYLQGSAPSSTGRRPSHSDASPVVSHGEPLTPQLPPGPQSPYIATSGGPGPQFRPTGIVQDSASPAVPNEDAVALQKRLMREKREAAIKRRKEEEEKEEAERRERIRLRMEKAGFTDKSSEKAGAKAPEKDVRPAQTPPATEGRDAQSKQQTQSPPKPPAPNATGQPQQYGLMKLHGPQPTSGLNSVEALTHKAVSSVAPAEKRPEAPVDKQSANMNGEAVTGKAPVKNEANIDAFQKGAPSDSRPPWSHVQPPQAQAQQQQQQQQAHAQSTASSGFPGWNNNTTATRISPSGSLWGPPASNHKALGNGDFQNNTSSSAALNTPQSQPYSHHLISPQPQPPPQPIGTPRQPLHQQRGDLSSIKSSDLTRSLAEDSQTIPAFPPEPTGSRPHQPGFQSLVSEQGRSTQPQPNVNMLAHPSEPPKTGVGAWHHFAANAAKDDARRYEQNKRDNEARLNEQRLSGHTPVITETWKRVSNTPGAVGSRRVIEATQAQHQRGYPGLESNAAPSLPPQQVRSRYQDLFEQSQRAVSMPAGPVRPGSPSAPPPDSVDHPAYNGALNKPLVNLPGSRAPEDDHPAKPVVRLPPSQAPQVASSTVTAEQRATSPATRVVSQPPPTWQDRFSNLLGKTSSEKKVSPVASAPQSASKAPFDASHTGRAATSVTLPPRHRRPSAPYIASFDPTFEAADALFEEPKEMGSVPAVRIPRLVPDAAYHPAKAPSVNLRSLRMMEPRGVLSIDPFRLPQAAMRGKAIAITVLMPGMGAPQTATMGHRPGSEPSAGRQRGAHNHTGSMRGNKRFPRHKRESTGRANAGPQQQPAQQGGQGSKSRPRSANMGGTNAGAGHPGDVVW